MAQRKEYRIGKRLIVYRNVFYLLATAMLFCFYFVYDYLFGTAYPALKGLPLIAIFVLLEGVVLAAGQWWCRRLIDGTVYTVTEQGLEIQLGTTRRNLAWKDFERAWYGTVDFTGSCPVTYRVKGQEFRPSAYLRDIWILNREIVERIRPYAQIEEGLETKIGAFI